MSAKWYRTSTDPLQRCDERSERSNKCQKKPLKIHLCDTARIAATSLAILGIIGGGPAGATTAIMLAKVKRLSTSPRLLRFQLTTFSVAVGGPVSRSRRPSEFVDVQGLALVRVYPSTAAAVRCRSLTQIGESLPPNIKPTLDRIGFDVKEHEAPEISYASDTLYRNA